MSDDTLDMMARVIFSTALVEDRAGELLDALFAGGSATVDADGKLVIVTGGQLRTLR